MHFSRHGSHTSVEMVSSSPLIRPRAAVARTAMLRAATSVKPPSRAPHSSSSAVTWSSGRVAMIAASSSSVMAANARSSNVRACRRFFNWLIGQPGYRGQMAAPRAFEQRKARGAGTIGRQRGRCMGCDGFTRRGRAHGAIVDRVDRRPDRARDRGTIAHGWDLVGGHAMNVVPARHHPQVDGRHPGDWPRVRNSGNADAGVYVHDFR